MTKRTRTALVILGLALAACGTSEDAAEDPTTTVVDAPTTTTEAETTTTEAASEANVITVAENDLGTFLVGGDGLALYLFVPDAQGDSTCYDQCEVAWPPLTGEVAAGNGIDASLLGTTNRTDGATQATYNGWPLYYFANDASAGDVNGQGANDVWYLLDPAGNGIGLEG